jgi:hypothetical protein
VAGRPENSETIARMREAVLHWLLDTADVIPHEADPRQPAVEAPAPGA